MSTAAHDCRVCTEFKLNYGICPGFLVESRRACGSFTLVAGGRGDVDPETGDLITTQERCPDIGEPLPPVGHSGRFPSDAVSPRRVAGAGHFCDVEKMLLSHTHRG